MPTDNATLLHYFLQDDIYLLKADKALLTNLPQAVPKIETEKPGFNYLGGNNGRFLILVNYAADEHMDAAHLKALENTLSRKNLLIADVAIFNMAKHSHHTWAEISGFFSPVKLLIMGADITPPGLPPAQFNVIAHKQGYSQLHTHNFTEMIADREKAAKAFWEQMKNF